MCEPCTACGAEVHIPEGLEPTELCNTCAQARVIELEAMVVELQRMLNDADWEIWYERGSGDFDPPYPDEWPEPRSAENLLGKRHADWAPNPKKTTFDFMIMRWSLLYLRICTSLPIEEAVERANQEHPTGLHSRWQVHAAGFGSPDNPEADGPNGVPCDDHLETHKHWLLSC